MPINPWGGFQQGTNQLINILAARREEKERQEQNALRNKLLGRQVGLQEEEAQSKRQGEARALIGKLLPGVKDQASYTSARSFVLSQYPEMKAANIPEEYNPQFVENLSRAYGVKPAEWKPTTKEEALELKTAGPAVKPDKTTFQAKTRTFVDPQTQKVISEEYDYDPGSGTRTTKGRYEYPVGTMILGYDAEGNAILGTTKGPFQTSKATGEDIPLSRTKVEKLKEEEAAVSNSIYSIRQIQQLVGQSASVIGAVGGAQRFVDSVSSQLQSLASLGGYQSTVKGKLGPDSQLLNPELYDFKGFAPEAAKSAQVKSLFTKLAYSIARAQEPGGRLSDRDVQGALTQLAGSTGSPDQMHAVLNLVAQNLEYEFSNRYRIMTKKEFPGFGETKKTNKYKDMSNEELLKLLEK